MSSLPLLPILLLSLVSVDISIEPSGTVHVHMVLQLNEGLNEIPLPVEPIVPSIVVNESGKVLIPIYQNGTLYVYAPAAGIASVDYIANVSAKDSILQFDIRANYSYDLRISSNIVLLTLLKNVKSVSYSNGELVVSLSGPQTVQYVVKKLATTTTRITSTSSITLTTTQLTTSRSTSLTTTTMPVTTQSLVPSVTRSTTTYTTTTAATYTTSTISSSIVSASATITTTSSRTTAPSSTSRTQSTHVTSSPSTRTTLRSSSTPSTVGYGLPPYAWIGLGIGIAIAVGLGIGLRLRRSATKSLDLSQLSPLDRDIIEVVEKSGGSILQSELQKRLGVPKTTLWRHIRKLERMGIIQVVKEGGYNKIVLKFKP